MTINVFGGGNTGGPAFPLQRSVRLRSSASAYFNRTPASASNRKTWTWSGWVKRGTSGSYQYLLDAYVSTNIESSIRFTNTDNLQIYQFNASAQYNVITTQVFRDPSSWYHIFVAFDTTQASSSDRVKVYVNGVQVTAFSTAVYPSLNFDSYINNTYLHSLGRASNAGGVYYYDGYLTEVNFIDGQALTPSSFGSINSTTGVWQPIKYSGTYGTNGFYLNFNDNSAATAAAIGKDSSGNGNNWTPNNISVTAGVTYDSMLDVPTLTSATNANYPTLSPIDTGGGSVTLSGGNLNYSIASSTGSQVRGTMGTDLTSKWYFEFTAGSAASPTNPQVFGISTVDGQITNNSSVLRLAAIIYTDGNTNYVASKYISGVTTNVTTQFRSVAIGDIMQVAYDAATGNLWFGKNNTWYDATNGTTGNPSTGANPVFTLPTGSQMTPFLCNLGATYSGSLNCGQRPFAYTPPSGFKSLNTYNLPAPTIPNGASNFAATTYTGTGSSLAISNTVNGKSFQPDLVWVKGRSGATDHALYDSVRGTTKDLVSNSTAAETTQATGLTAFDTGGFTVGALAKMNTNTATYVGWQWKASNAAPVTNTSGTITSSVSANPSAGFSIVTWTVPASGAYTVGHGLGIAPSMIIMKDRTNGTTSWITYHKSISTTTALYLILNSTGATASSAGIWGSALPTSTVFGNTVAVGTLASDSVVAYCFSEIAGYSKFGSYTGNGSTDGPFVYLGFRPRFILFKNTTAYNWQILDTSRATYNQGTVTLFPNLSNAENTTAIQYDILSNGFKIRTSDAGSNGSGNAIIYAAFAESPFNYSLAR